MFRMNIPHPPSSSCYLLWEGGSASYDWLLVAEPQKFDHAVSQDCNTVLQAAAGSVLSTIARDHLWPIQLAQRPSHSTNTAVSSCKQQTVTVKVLLLFNSLTQQHWLPRATNQQQCLFTYQNWNLAVQITCSHAWFCRLHMNGDHLVQGRF